MNFTKYKLPIFVSLIWLWVIIAFYMYLQIQWLSLEELIFTQYNYMREYMIIGALLFIIIFTIRPLVFIPASPLDLFAWAVFGLWWGIIICLVANGTSCLFSYAVWRSTGWYFSEHISDWGRIEKIQSKLHTDTFFTVCIIRLLFFPFDLTNYICGALKIPVTPYFWATMIAWIPGVFIFVLAGAAFYGQDINSLSEVSQNINYNYLYFASWLFLISVIISKILKKKYSW